jgi:hypothetical protein
MQVTSTLRLTAHELDAMERRCNAASPGPWFSYVVGRDLEAGLNCIELGNASLMEVLGGTVADQDFIAGAREDMARLIAEVRTLRRLLEAAATESHARVMITPVMAEQRDPALL